MCSLPALVLLHVYIRPADSYIKRFAFTNICPASDIRLCVLHPWYLYLGYSFQSVTNKKALWLSVDPEYLMPCFKDYGVKKGSSAAPDVAAFLEKTDEQSTKPLTAEGYQVFRKCLGKLLWLAQTRHDVKAWLSLVGSVQSNPTVAADQALKAILRFLFDDRYTQLRMPSESLELTCDGDRVMTQLNVWSDDRTPHIDSINERASQDLSSLT